jgi:hypothetical protein
MAAEWLALAESGAAVLVSAAATDVWSSARKGIIALFGRGGENRQELAGELLDEVATEVEQAPPEGRDEIRRQLASAWKTRLADLLQEYPEAADELRSWASAVQTQLPAVEQQWAQSNIAHGHGVVFGVQGGNQYVYYEPLAGGAGNAPGEAGTR